MSNLNFDQVAANQNQKEVTINDAFDQVDDALTEHLAVDLSAADVSLTADQWTRNWFFEMTGHSVARTVIIPATKRPAVVKNSGTAPVTLQVQSGGSAVVDSGQAVMVYNDGVNLTVTGGGSSLPDMVGNAGKVLAVNANEDDVEWVKGNVVGYAMDRSPSGPIQGASSASAYATKGQIIDITVDSVLLGVNLYLGGPIGGIYKLYVAKVNKANDTISEILGISDPLTLSTATRTLYNIMLPSFVQMNVGDRIAVLIVLTSGTADSVATPDFPPNAGLNGAYFSYYGCTRHALLPPAVSDSIFYSNTLSVYFEFIAAVKVVG